MDLKNRSILVTGGYGFFGSQIVKTLRRHGLDGRVVIRYRSNQLDLTRQKDCDSTILRNNIIIHAAGMVGGIGFNRENPALMFEQNMRMGLNLISAAVRKKAAKFVLLGTVCAYPKLTPVPFKEDQLWQGFPEETNAPYGIAKRALHVYLNACREQFGLNGIYLLPVNLYGPGDHFDEKKSHVIPALIKRIAEAKEKGFASVTIWGTGQASREFLYVEDAAQAVVMATERYDEPEPVNIGAGFEIKIKDLVNLIVNLIGYKGDIKWDHSKPDGQPRRCLDTSRALAKFGFKAETDFEEGLRRTIDWYYKNTDHPD